MFYNLSKIKRWLILEAISLFICFLIIIYLLPPEDYFNNSNNLLHFLIPHDTFKLDQIDLCWEVIFYTILFVFIPFNILIYINELKYKPNNYIILFIMILFFVFSSFMIKNELNLEKMLFERTISSNIKGRCLLNNGCNKIPDRFVVFNDNESIIYSLNSIAMQIKTLEPPFNYKLKNYVKTENLNNSSTLYNFEINSLKTKNIYNTFKNPSNIILKINSTDKINLSITKKNDFCELSFNSIKKNDQKINFIDILVKLEKENNMNNLLNPIQYKEVNLGLLTKQVSCSAYGL